MFDKQFKQKKHRTKSEFEIHDKFTKQVVGMRRGKQFDFVKIKYPEAEDKLRSNKVTVPKSKRSSSSSESLSQDFSDNSSEIDSPKPWEKALRTGEETPFMGPKSILKSNQNEHEYGGSARSLRSLRSRTHYDERSLSFDGKFILLILASTIYRLSNFCKKTRT
jgi:hypothetical protein